MSTNVHPTSIMLFLTAKRSDKWPSPEGGRSHWCSCRASGAHWAGQGASRDGARAAYLDDFGELIERVLTVSTILLSQLQDVAIHTG